MIRSANKNLLILLASVIAFWSWLSLPLAHGANIRADFNGDGFDDLAIGAPGENKGAGAVHVIYGSATGLTTSGNQFFRQGSTGVPDSAESGDNCGAALVAADFNGMVLTIWRWDVPVRILEATLMQARSSFCMDPQPA